MTPRADRAINVGDDDMGHAGAITSYREATGTETFSSTTPAAWAWDTLLNEDDAITLDTGSTSSIFTVQTGGAGHYFVTYNTVYRTSNAVGRLEMATKHRIDVNGTDLVDLRNVSFVYSQGGANRAYATASGIIELAEGDEVKVEYNRQDSNTIVNAARVAASSGVSFLKLKDDWPVFRAYRSSNSAEITSTQVDLEWNAQDEVGSHFRHSTSTDPGIITLTAENRHYLICVNVVCTRSQSNSTHVVPRMFMLADDGAGGTFTTVALPSCVSYMHNGSNCNETSLNMAFIWAPPVPNQRIRFNVFNASDGSGTNDWVALANQTAISIVSLPEPGDPEAADTQYVIVHDDGGGQAADADAFLGMDTTDEDSDFLTHQEPGDDTSIAVATAGWYLFFGGGFSVRTGGSSTPLAHRFIWYGGGAPATWGQFGRQDLGDGISNGNQAESGCFGALLAELPASIEIQLFHLEDSSGTDTDCDFGASGGIAVQGVRLAGLFPSLASCR